MSDPTEKEHEPITPKFASTENSPEVVLYIADMCIGSLRSNNITMDFFEKQEFLKGVITHWLNESYRVGIRKGESNALRRIR